MILHGGSWGGHLSTLCNFPMERRAPSPVCFYHVSEYAISTTAADCSQRSFTGSLCLNQFHAQAIRVMETSRNSIHSSVGRKVSVGPISWRMPTFQVEP